jgi:hypothetical protein
MKKPIAKSEIKAHFPSKYRLPTYSNFSANGIKELRELLAKYPSEPHELILLGYRIAMARVEKEKEK